LPDGKIKRASDKSMSSPLAKNIPLRRLLKSALLSGRRCVPSHFAASLGVWRPIKPVDTGENGNVVIADLADTGQPALSALAERNVVPW
jgi:hypothetical protein